MNEELKNIQNELEECALNSNYDNSLNEWKQSFDDIMIKHAKQGSIFNYYVKCDEENNIYLEQDIKVIDVYVEPKRGEGIFVNQITVTKSGTIEKNGYNQL